jgi:hypothetical protein
MSRRHAVPRRPYRVATFTFAQLANAPRARTRARVDRDGRGSAGAAHARIPCNPSGKSCRDEGSAPRIRTGRRRHAAWSTSPGGNAPLADYLESNPRPSKQRSGLADYLLENACLYRSKGCSRHFAAETRPKRASPREPCAGAASAAQDLRKPPNSRARDRTGRPGTTSFFPLEARLDLVSGGSQIFACAPQISFDV